jgi:metal transporter CNNM
MLAWLATTNAHQRTHTCQCPTAMDLTHHTVKDIAIAMSDVFMLDEEAVLDFECLVQILAKGHSRVPVFSKNRHNIVGVLMVKKLIVIDPADTRQ